jgi:hypothetical protein
MATWLQLLTAALGGGFVVKVLDIVYNEITKFRVDRRDARRIVERHLDPVVKAADEVVGKVRALAERDFQEFATFDLENRPEHLFRESRSVTSMVYLFGVFWCRLELLRQESLYVELTRDERGKVLKQFMDCLESRRLRIIDRISQRAIGELMIERTNGNVGPTSYVRLAKLYDSDEDTRAWMDIPLTLFIEAYRNKEVRQLILVYGAVMHALIDTLDPKHHATKDRPGFPNKLAVKSRRDLKHRVFKIYVPSVKNTIKYHSGL